MVCLVFDSIYIGNFSQIRFHLEISLFEHTY